MTTRQSKPLEAGELLQHTAFVTAMARGVLGRDPLADDAVQETWLAALRGAGPRKPGALRSWLGSISRRRAQDLRRKQAVHDRLEGQAAQPGTEPSTAELAARAELGRTMVAAVLALDEPYREVLLLRYYEDLPPRAIASRLGLPVETVRTRTRRGLERLRAELTRSRGGDRKAWSAVLLRWIGAESAGPATAGVGVGVGVLVAVTCIAVIVGMLALRSGEVPVPPAEELGVTAVLDEHGGATLDGVAGEAPAADENSQSDAPPVPPAVRGHMVSGFVRDATGTPVAGIPVRYSLKRPREEDAPWSKEDWRLSEAYTDAHGAYKIQGLATGALWLNLLSERGVGGSHEVDHDLRGDWTHDFVVRGTLRFAGHVSVPSGKAAQLWLDFREERAGGAWGNIWGVRKLSLPPDGRFDLTAMRPGVYGLHVQAEGAAKFEARLELLEDTLDHAIRLRAGCKLECLLTLPSGFELARPARYWLRPDSGGWQRTGTFDEAQRVRLEGLPEGACTMYIRAHQKEGDENKELLLERTVPVPVRPGTEPIELVITPDEEISLHVTTADRATQLSGTLHVLGSPAGKVQLPFEVEVKPDGTQTTVSGSFSTAWPPQRVTTASGALRVPGLPRGEYRVRIEAIGYEPYEAAIVVNGPQRLEAVLRRQAGQLVRAGVKSQYYRIYARNEEASDRQWQQILWRDGRVQISGRQTPGVREVFLSPGRYVFRLVSRELAEAFTGSTDVVDGAAPLDLAFDIPRGVVVSGRVRAGTGRGPALLLHLFRMDTNGGLRRLEHKEAHCNEGRYQMSGLRAGTYIISGSVAGAPALATFTVESEDLTVDLDVVGSTGAPGPVDSEPQPDAPAPGPPERPDK